LHLRQALARKFPHFVDSVHINVIHKNDIHEKILTRRSSPLSDCHEQRAGCLS
jgi:hypothetical protein